MTEAPAHLGGYTVGGDPATWYPDLWNWLFHEEHVQSMLDVGCGEGHTLRFFRDELGCAVAGVDGIAQQEASVVVHDYTEGPLEMVPADLVWCCEFVEHVEERYIPNFLATFKAAPLVLITHAEPGQQGHHHVNCKPPVYWVGVMAAVGYEIDERLTSLSRVIASLNTHPMNHYVRSGIAFRRNA